MTLTGTVSVAAVSAVHWLFGYHAHSWGWPINDEQGIAWEHCTKCGDRRKPLVDFTPNPRFSKHKESKTI